MTTERPPSEPEERERRRLERLLPEVVKRLVEAGYKNISEGPDNVRELVRDMKLPKEALALMLTQVDETKNGLYRVVAKEIRDFLEHTNFAEEMAKVLTTLSFEIKTEVRFIPNDAKPGSPPKPDVKAKVSIKKDRPDDETDEAEEGEAGEAEEQAGEESSGEEQEETP